MTKYLILYKKVCIPHIGTFEVIQQPPQLNVADKLVYPPSFQTNFSTEDFIPEYQYDFLASAEIEKEKIRKELFLFGEKLRNRIFQSPFYWKGFGTLRSNAGEIVFEAEKMETLSLQNIAAQKVLRENVQHRILVGDREISSQQINEGVNEIRTAIPWFIITGWAILIFTVIVIFLILYFKNFHGTATGLQTMF